MATLCGVLFLALHFLGWEPSHQMHIPPSEHHQEVAVPSDALHLLDGNGIPRIQAVGTHILFWHDDPAGYGQQWHEFSWRFMAPVRPLQSYLGVVNGYAAIEVLPAPWSRSSPGTFRMSFSQALWGQNLSYDPKQPHQCFFELVSMAVFGHEEGARFLRRVACSEWGKGREPGSPGQDSTN